MPGKPACRPAGVVHVGATEPVGVLGQLRVVVDAGLIHQQSPLALIYIITIHDTTPHHTKPRHTAPHTTPHYTTATHHTTLLRTIPCHSQLQKISRLRGDQHHGRVIPQVHGAGRPQYYCAGPGRPRGREGAGRGRSGRSLVQDSSVFQVHKQGQGQTRLGATGGNLIHMHTNRLSLLLVAGSRGSGWPRSPHCTAPYGKRKKLGLGLGRQWLWPWQWRGPGLGLQLACTQGQLCVLGVGAGSFGPGLGVGVSSFGPGLGNAEHRAAGWGLASALAAALWH